VLRNQRIDQRANRVAVADLTEAGAGSVTISLFLSFSARIYGVAKPGRRD